MVMRKTKIICTLGPATNNEEKIRQLMLNGMDVARMNFSHGDHASHLATLNIIKKVREELNLPVAALLDTKALKSVSASLKMTELNCIQAIHSH